MNISMFVYSYRKLTEFLQEDVLKPLVSHKLHPGVEYGQDVVGVLGAAVPCLQERFHLS